MRCEPGSAERFFRAQSSVRRAIETIPRPVAFDEATIFFYKNPKFAPGNGDCSAEKVRHKIEGDLAAKDEHPDTFPSQPNQENGVFAVRTKDFVNLFQIRAIGQQIHAPERVGECRTLKGAHQLKHRIPPLPLAVMTDLHRREDHAGGDGESIDKIRESREIHGDALDRLAVGRFLGPTSRRIFPIFLPAIRSRVEQAIGIRKPFASASVRRVGVVNVAIDSEEDA